MVEGTTEYSPLAESARSKAPITEAALVLGWKPQTLTPDVARLMVVADGQTLRGRSG